MKKEKMPIWISLAIMGILFFVANVQVNKRVDNVVKLSLTLADNMQYYRKQYPLDLVYPYQGWTYGTKYGCRGDTVVVYEYIDSVRIYSGKRDTIIDWRKDEEK